MQVCVHANECVFINLVCFFHMVYACMFWGCIDIIVLHMRRVDRSCSKNFNMLSYTDILIKEMKVCIICCCGPSHVASSS